MNGQLSSWSNIESGLSQGSIRGPLLFLININHLSEGLTTNARYLAEEVILFSVVDNINLSTTKDVIFSRKIKKTSHHPLNFNNNSVKQVQFQKYLGVFLDGKMDFREHLKNMFKKVNKTISLLRKLQNNLP